MRKYLILSLAVSTNVTSGVCVIFYFVFPSINRKFIYWILFTISKIIRYTMSLLLIFKEPYSKEFHIQKKIFLHAWLFALNIFQKSVVYFSQKYFKKFFKFKEGKKKIITVFSKRKKIFQLNHKFIFVVFTERCHALIILSNRNENI